MFSRASTVNEIIEVEVKIRKMFFIKRIEIALFESILEPIILDNLKLTTIICSKNKSLGENVFQAIKYVCMAYNEKTPANVSILFEDDSHHFAKFKRTTNTQGEHAYFFHYENSVDQVIYSNYFVENLLNRNSNNII